MQLILENLQFSRKFQTFQNISNIYIIWLRVHNRRVHCRLTQTRECCRFIYIYLYDMIYVCIYIYTHIFLYQQIKAVSRMSKPSTVFNSIFLHVHHIVNLSTQSPSPSIKKATKPMNAKDKPQNNSMANRRCLRLT